MHPSRPGLEGQAPAERDMAQRLRVALAWAGIVTLVILSGLALVHLALDLQPVLAIRGGWSARLLRVLPVAALSLAALGLALLVAWLAGSTRRRVGAAVIIAFFILVVVRVVVAASFDGAITGEPGVYRDMAESLLTPEWDFKDRPMAYAFALAGGFAISPDRQLVVEAVNLLMAMLAGGAVLGLARSMYGARAGALALLGYAVWPAAALMTVVSIPQIAFDLAVVAAAWAATATPPGVRGHALTGALVGLGQYLRPTAPVMLPAYILARLWPGGSRRALLSAVAVPVLGFLLVLVPVALYNLDRLASLSISTSEYGGHSLYMGTYEPSGGTFSEVADAELIALAGSEDVATRSAKGMEIALQRIREDPVAIAALGIRKQDTLWGTEHYGVQYGIGHRFRDRPDLPVATAPMLLSQGFYILVLLSATAGLWLVRRRPDALVPLAVTLIWTVALVHALVEVRDRHHSYVIPLLLPISALAFATLYESAGRRLAHWRSS